MNNTVSLNIKTDIRELKGEVKYLRTMLEKVILLLGDPSRLKDDVLSKELMIDASRVFNVTSKKSRDDTNIANPKNIKPVDFSSYV